LYQHSNDEIAKLIDFSEVQSRTGNLSRATYWRLRRDHLFPNPVAISPGRKAWRENEINDWIASRKPERAA
jgi:prophage regulatory protein